MYIKFLVLIGSVRYQSIADTASANMSIKYVRHRRWSVVAATIDLNALACDVAR